MRRLSGARVEIRDGDGRESGESRGDSGPVSGEIEKELYIQIYIYIYIRIHSDLSKMSTHVNAVVSHPSLVS